MKNRCEKFKILLQFPIEIIFCIIAILSYIFPDCSFLFGKGDYGESWLTFSCALAYTARNAEYFKKHRLYWYVSVGILCPLLYALCPMIHILSRSTILSLPFLGFACVLSCCKQDDFFNSYTTLTNNIIKTYVCGLVTIICLGLTNIIFFGSNFIPPTCIFILLFCFFQKKEEEDNPDQRWNKLIFILNILISAIALIGLLWLVIDEANNLADQIPMRRYRNRFYSYLDDSVFLLIVSLHCLLISTPYKKKVFKIISQIANFIAIIALVYISIIVNKQELNFNLIWRILFACSLLIAHFFIFIKPNRDVRKSFLVSTFAIVTAFTFGSACYDIYINIYEEKVKNFAEKYELTRSSFSGKIKRTPKIPIEALKDPDFQEFMDNREKLFSLKCFTYDFDSLLLKTKYSVTADSVIIEKADGERISYSIEEYNAE